MKKDKKNTISSESTIEAKQVAGRSKLRHERNRSYFLNVLLLLVIAVQAVGLMMLSEWQTVIPVISVIDSNGNVVKQEVVSKESIMADEAMVQREIYAFIQSANTFDLNWRQHYADLTHIRSTPTVAQQYDLEISNTSPDNPYYLLPNSRARWVPKITGINILAKDMVQVKIQLILDDPTPEERKESKYIRSLYYTALVKYTFTGTPLSLGDRWENPLGFVVTSYRKDQELSQ